MTYNVHWDSIFPNDDPMNHDLREFDRADAFIRVMRAVQPDIICLQEINDLRDLRELGKFMAQVMGSTEDKSWQVATQRDNVIATRFKIEEIGHDLISESFHSDLSQATALVDLPDSQFGKSELYVICAHFESGGQDEDISLRQRQADAAMSFVGDLTTPGDSYDLPPGTPFVILGDFNVYETDPHLHLWTLLRGDIINETEYGADFQPDWDGSQLTDAAPSHNGLGAEFYTWRNDRLPFSPGALDRTIYSDSVLLAENAFVLNTMTLTDEALALYGLFRDDVVLDIDSGYYDHLPVVVDFVIVETP
ncbi:MAG: endonuclease/exonuclease/phosphatase family protein [Anaerolineales bacterium]